jgi:hypothetical protein
VSRPMVERKGHAALHRHYRVRGGTHVDGLHGTYGDRVRPLLPCARRAFLRLVKWVEHCRRPPQSATLDRCMRGPAGRGADQTQWFGTQPKRDRGRRRLLLGVVRTSLFHRFGGVARRT